MTQEHDVFRTVGRGGAGNYVASKKPDAASKDDPNASGNQRNGLQPVSSGELSTSVAPPPRASSRGPARVGRGGAGNYVDPDELPDPEEQMRMASKAAAAVDSSNRDQPHRGRLGGRGGAGNWKGDSTEDKPKEDGLLGKVTELEQRVKEAVDKSVKLPEKVHHGREKLAAKGQW